MNLVETARALAAEAHAGQARKSTPELPYTAHLAAVAERLRSFGCDDELTLAAAWLHDLLEDQPAFAPRLQVELPPEVVAVVAVLSEQRLDAAGRLRHEEDRFASYLAQLRGDSEAARRALPISCADKIDNARDLVQSERDGKRLLVRLNTRPGQQLRHLAVLRPLYAAAVPPPMLAEFDRATAELAACIRAWLPGRAVAIAAAAHLGQFDRAGAPYIFHPLRVMMRGRTAAERMVGVLHDVVEDTSWRLPELIAEGFSDEIVAAIDRLTRRAEESYEAFIERVLEDPLATRVKLHDLEDNLDPLRLSDLGASDAERLQKYHRARRRILGHSGA